MGRKSTLRRLQPEIQAEINRILSEGRLTLDELLEHLRGIGVEGLSRSALGRQKQKIDKIAAKLRQSREMTEALVREIGPAVEEGQQGRLLVEVLRRLVFDHLEKRLTSEDEESQDIDNQGFFFLAKAIKEMSQANRLDQDFEAKVRERIQKETEKKLDAAASRAADDVPCHGGLVQTYGGHLSGGGRRAAAQYQGIESRLRR